MVISLSDLERLEIGVDVLSYRLAAYEIHRSAGYRLALAERDLCLVRREIFRCIECQDMAEDVTVSFAVEVEICVVGEVDHRRSVRLCSKGQTELVLLAPVIARHRLYGSGISLLSVLGIVEEFHAAFILTAFPHLVLEAFRTAVEAVRAVVYRKRVFLAVQSELSEGYAVGISSRYLSGTWTVTEIACRLRIAQNYVSHVSVLVRNDYGHDGRTEIRKFHICAVCVGKCIEINLLSAGRLAPKFSCDVHIDDVFVFPKGINSVKNKIIISKGQQKSNHPS